MWHYNRFGEFSEGFRCLSSSGMLYTYLNSSREQLRGNRIAGEKITKGKKGTQSYNFYDEVTLTHNKDGRLNGIKSRGKKIMGLRKGASEFHVDRRAKVSFQRFKEELSKVAKEPVTTNESWVSARITDKTGVLTPDLRTEESVRRNLSEEFEREQDSIELAPPTTQSVKTITREIPRDEVLEEVKAGTIALIKSGKIKSEQGYRVYNLVKRGIITPGEGRESRGLLATEKEIKESDYPLLAAKEKVKVIEKIEIPYYKRLEKEARGKKDVDRAFVFSRVAEWADIEVDKILQKMNEPLVGERSEEILERVIDDNEWVRLEKVKKFLKENAIAISGVGIMLATFITSIVSIVKSGVKTVRSTTNKISKPFKEIGKKLGPILGPIFSLAETIISLAGKGAGFLLENLWLLFLFLHYLAYDWIEKKRKKN